MFGDNSRSRPLMFISTYNHKVESMIQSFPLLAWSNTLINSFRNNIVCYGVFHLAHVNARSPNPLTWGVEIEKSTIPMTSSSYSLKSFETGSGVMADLDPGIVDVKITRSADPTTWASVAFLDLLDWFTVKSVVL